MAMYTIKYYMTIYYMLHQLYIIIHSFLKTNLNPIYKIHKQTITVNAQIIIFKLTLLEEHNLIFHMYSKKKPKM